MAGYMKIQYRPTVMDVHRVLLDGGVHPSYCRRGIASALIAHALQAAVRQGYDRALLSVDSENATGAFGIFERAGFTATRRYVKWER
ncbi:GNAT family N-acetyltransferase [Lentzea sp. CA-135723]|uniref:GNAT family N-acetyltransferase n=1 Tax=Lentzea sp. CA-135723 TaxID=3239950 RepID=UPI003D907091